MTTPGVHDPRIIHLFTDAASWTSLAAVAALTTCDDPALPAAAIDVTPFKPSDRAASMTLRTGRPADTSIPSGALVVTWDQPAERWASARGVQTRPAPTDVPIPSHMISPRPDARRILGIGDDELAVAVLDSAPARVSPADAALLAAATGLAGTPVVIVLLSGTTPDRGDARSLEKVGRGARVIAATEPPWRVLAGCDLMLPAAAPGIGDEIERDLARWAAAARIPLARPPTHQADANPARRRFALARTLVHALDGEPDALEPAPEPLASESGDETAWLDRLRAAIDPGYSSV